MEKIKTWVIVLQFIAIFILVIFYPETKKENQSPLELKHINTNIHKYERGVEVKIKAIENKKREIKRLNTIPLPIYSTSFDSLDTKDSVLVELIKADTVVSFLKEGIAQRDTVIAIQDIVISDQKGILALEKEAHKQDLLEMKEERKQHRKQKRKAFFSGTGAGGVVAIVLILFL